MSYKRTKTRTAAPPRKLFYDGFRGGRGMMGGMGALGDSGCARMAVSIDGTQNECIDANGNVISSTPIPGATPYGQPAGSSSGGSSWASVVGALFGNALKPAAPGGYYPPQTGMDTTTILLIGGVGVLALFMIMKD